MLSHKHHIATLLQALFVLCSFSACVNDEFADGVINDGKVTHPCYLNIQLKFDENMSSTRATETNGDDLEYGDHNEHMVGQEGNYIILFKDDNLFDVCELTAMTGHKHNTEDGRPTPNGDDYSNKDNGVDENIEATYTYSSKFDAEEEKDFPTSCLVVLNASEKISDKLKDFKEKKKGLGVNDILGIVWEETGEGEDPADIGFSDNTHKYFTLTNSIYFKENNAGKRDTVGIPKDFIGKTLAEAQPLTVYVERMVAKFSFELPKQDGNYVNIFQPSDKADMVLFDKGFNTDGSPNLKVKKWRIVLTGWNMNAFETQNHLFKNIQGGKDYFGDYDDKDDWNHPKNYRSHWSEDPHYDYVKNTQTPLKYPWQYRKAIDYSLQDYDMLISGDFNDNLLRNYSFHELGLDGLRNGAEIENAIENAFHEKTIYTPENTYDAKAVAGQGKNHDSRDELLAGTHLLVGAEVQIKLMGADDSDVTKEEIDKEREYFIPGTITEEGNNTWGTPKHLFRDRNGFCYLSERECLASLVHDFNQLLESQNSLVFTYYNWDTRGGGDPPKMIAVTNGNYKLYYKNGDEWEELTEEVILKTGADEVFTDDDLEMPIATIRRGDGKRLPWIEKLLDENRLAIGTSPTDPSAKIHTAVISEEAYGAYVPAQYQGTTDEDKNFMKSLFYEWLGAIDHFNEGKMYYSHGVVDNPPIEDKRLRYGVVRNNWYQFKLKDVKSLGTPVDDIHQPIVPERNGLFDQINFTIKILGWHTVEEYIDGI